MRYRVSWDNEHACGDLPGLYDTFEEADAAGLEWFNSMVAADEDPEEAAEVYGWEVHEVNGDDDEDDEDDEDDRIDPLDDFMRPPVSLPPATD